MCITFREKMWKLQRQLYLQMQRKIYQHQRTRCRAKVNFPQVGRDLNQRQNYPTGIGAPRWIAQAFFSSKGHRGVRVSRLGTTLCRSRQTFEEIHGSAEAIADTGTCTTFRKRSHFSLKKELYWFVITFLDEAVKTDKCARYFSVAQTRQSQEKLDIDK